MLSKSASLDVSLTQQTKSQADLNKTLGTIVEYEMSASVSAGKGGSYWGPFYFWLLIPNLCNTYPCYPQHKLANDHVACNKLFVKTAQLLAKQVPDGEVFGVSAQPATKKEE